MPPLHNGVKAATLSVVGPVNVELAGVAKSTWNLNRRSELVAKSRKNAGSPAVGCMVPSMSEGSRLSIAVLCWKQIMVAAVPASIAERLAAQASAPRNVVPIALNMLKEK